MAQMSMLSEVEVWLSVDPLAEKYPGWSPYNYTLLNPVKLVDPDGREIKNADKKRRDKAEQRLAKNKAIVNNAESLYGTKRRDFKNKKQFKRYKHFVKEVKSARRDVKKYTRRTKITESRISEFKKNSPKMFAAMDNIKNEYGESVDVMVGVDKMAGYNGKNEFAFDIDPVGEVRLVTEEFKENTVNIFLGEIMYKGENGLVPTNIEVTKHEMGHAYYNIQNTSNYYGYYQTLNKAQKAQKGHNVGNPSGENADRWQNKNDL